MGVGWNPTGTHWDIYENLPGILGVHWDSTGKGGSVISTGSYMMSSNGQLPPNGALMGMNDPSMAEPWR